MVVAFTRGVFAVTVTATGVDQAGAAVQIELTAYPFDADDAQIAVAMIEEEVVNEPVIPDGQGAFTTPQQVTAISVAASPLPVSQLVFKREASGSNTKFPVNSIHEVELIASLTSEAVSAPVTVYVLNASLGAAITLAKTHVQTMHILQDPWGPPGQMIPPDKVLALGAKPISSVVDPWKQIILKS
jgi:hypothetical protein